MLKQATFGAPPPLALHVVEDISNLTKLKLAMRRVWRVAKAFTHLSRRTLNAPLVAKAITPMSVQLHPFPNAVLAHLVRGAKLSWPTHLQLVSCAVQALLRTSLELLLLSTADCARLAQRASILGKQHALLAMLKKLALSLAVLLRLDLGHLSKKAPAFMIQILFETLYSHLTKH